MLTKLQKLLRMDAEAGGGSGSGSDGAGDGQGDNSGGGTSLEWKTWFDGQPEDVKALISKQEAGLKSALDAERGNRKDLEKQLREMAGKAEKGSEAETKLTTMADQIAEADRKADFYEAAHAAGVTNLKLAYLVAVQDELFDRRGSVNFEVLKTGYPELFGGKLKPAGNAGAGTGEGPPKKGSMNDFIRAAAGRK